jgi:hypothetical protein
MHERAHHHPFAERLWTLTNGSPAKPLRASCANHASSVRTAHDGLTRHAPVAVPPIPSGCRLTSCTQRQLEDHDTPLETGARGLYSGHRG